MKVESAGQDHQIASAATPEFSLDQLQVAAAGGFIIQMMPDTDNEVIAYLEQHLPTVPNPTVMVSEGLTAIDMLQRALGDLDLSLLEEREPKFQCSCSGERVRFMVSALGRDEVADMLDKDNGAEITCHYCNEKYRVSGEELQEMLKTL